MLTLTPLVIEGINLGIQYAPAIIDAVKTEISLFNSKAPPTAAQLTEIDAALEHAHQQLQLAQQGPAPAPIPDPNATPLPDPEPEHLIETGGTFDSGTGTFTGSTTEEGI